MDFYHISYWSYYWNILIAWAGHWLQYLKAAYTGNPVEIKVAIAVIVGAVLAMAAIACSMLRRSLREWRQRRHLQHIRERFGDKIDYVLSDPDVVSQNLTKEEIRKMLGDDALKCLKKKRDKRLFCQLVYDRLIDDEGELCSISNLRQMLNVLGLCRFLETEVDHGNWKRKMASLNMMNMFRLDVDSWLTNALLLSKSQLVRRQAMHASIMSSADSNLEYFESDYFDRHSCIKDEIELGYSLYRRRVAGLQLPNLARLAHLQANADTQCIFVRLMRYFGQCEYCSQLADLFKQSKSHRLTEEIACTWGYLKYTDGEALLKEALLTQSDDVQVAIMQALTRMDTGQSENELAKIYQSAANKVISFEALRCLYNYGASGKDRFMQLEVAAKGTQKEDLFATFRNEIMKKRIAIDRELDYQPILPTVYNATA